MSTEGDRKKLFELTEREYHVLRTLCAVLKDRTIRNKYAVVGERLHITEGAVKSHTDKIFTKLGIYRYSHAHRVQALIQRYCPLLRELELSAVPSGKRSEPKPVPESRKRRVEERKRSAARKPRKAPQSHQRRRSSRWPLVGVALLALLIVAIFYAFGGYRLLKPSTLGVGDEWSDDRVSLVMTEHRLSKKWHITFFPMDFHFEFKNHSGEEILLRFDAGEFSLADNAGRSYPCGICDPIWGGMLEDVNRTVPIAGTYEFWLCCGANTHFDEEVSYVVLSAPGISSLDPVSWRVDIPH